MESFRHGDSVNLMGYRTIAKDLVDSALTPVDRIGQFEKLNIFVSAQFLSPTGSWLYEVDSSIVWLGPIDD